MVKSLEDQFERMRALEKLTGHSHDEMMEMGQHPQHRPILNKNNSKTIGYLTYDFENKTEKFTPTLKHRIISSFNQFYSRIRSYFYNRNEFSQ